VGRVPDEQAVLDIGGLVEAEDAAHLLPFLEGGVEPGQADDRIPQVAEDAETDQGDRQEDDNRLNQSPGDICGHRLDVKSARQGRIFAALTHMLIRYFAKEISL